MKEQKRFSRRSIVRVLAGTAGYILGAQNHAQAQSGKAPLLLALDGMGAEAIVIQYRGQRVSISPQEIIDALK